MRKICFVTCGALPVPAIKGGAIEQLIELLINENERTPKFEFTVVECCDSKVEQEFKKYKYTHFVQLKHPKSRENKLWWKLSHQLFAQKAPKDWLCLHTDSGAGHWGAARGEAPKAF